MVIPVKDGEPYLEEVLDALRREGPDEVLVIDSGSRDRSEQIARSSGVEVLSIEPHEFGHGRTRNLGAERTSGDLICFLTQDATPCSGWLAAYKEAFALSPRVGAAYGPHLPRESTSPMIARELTEFFAGFSSDGRPRVQQPGDPEFLSNVNACYARSCWEEIRFHDVDYAEDQAFGADMFARGWLKVYHPGAAVLHAHQYGWSGFMRRYFDEYRGLRGTIGHVEKLGLRSTLRDVRANVSGDRRWLAENGVVGTEAARWIARSAAHHGGRKVFAALGSRADHLPAPARRTLSLERRDGRAPQLPVVPRIPTRPIAPGRAHGQFEEVMLVNRDGPAPLLDLPPGMIDRDRLRVALVLPPFSKGSGGHYLLLQILRRLELRGHVCSVWIHDYYGGWGSLGGAQIRHDIREYFAPIEGTVYNGFEEWHGADVVIATGWQTVHPVLLLPDCHARVYMVNDYEPDFFAASAERSIALDTYRHGMHCIAGSPWLRDLLSERHGAAAEAFQYGVDHDIYRPRDEVPRRTDTVIYYARISTHRRAVPIGLLALGELYRRRPNTRIVLFGTEEYIRTPFPYELAGVLAPEELARLYAEATVGLCLSLTNLSLMPKEMLACGLPCVELAGVSAESIFGEAGPIELAPLDPSRLADAMERLLEDRELWQKRSADGRAFVASYTWERSTDEVEAGLRHALMLREQSALRGADRVAASGPGHP